MNCKHGDLAVILPSGEKPSFPVQRPNSGRIVRCVRVAGPDDLPADVPRVAFDAIAPLWVVDQPLLWSQMGKPMWCHLARDERMRPIRDNDGEDETLTWAGKPSDIKTPEAA